MEENKDLKRSDNSQAQGEVKAPKTETASLHNGERNVKYDLEGELDLEIDTTKKVELDGTAIDEAAKSATSNGESLSPSSTAEGDTASPENASDGKAESSSNNSKPQDKADTMPDDNSINTQEDSDKKNGEKPTENSAATDSKKEQDAGSKNPVASGREGFDDAPHHEAPDTSKDMAPKEGLDNSKNGLPSNNQPSKNDSTSNNSSVQTNSPKQQNSSTKPNNSAQVGASGNQSAASKPQAKSQSGGGQRRSPKNYAQDKFNNSNVGQKYNNAKNFVQNPKAGMKNYAQNKFNNTKLGQGVQKGKDAYNKAKKAAQAAKKAGKVAAKAGKAAAKGLGHLIAATMPWSLLVILGLFLIIIVIVVVLRFIPGFQGDTSSNKEKGNYSSLDQKTIEKLHKIFGKYPNADGALAMTIVAYPYYDSLQGGSVKLFFDALGDEDASDDSAEDDLDAEVGDNDENESDNPDDNYNDSGDDPFLELFQYRKAKKRLEAVLKKMSSMGEDEFKNYLKDTYFKKDKGVGFDKYGFDGYNEMFKKVDKDDLDSLKDAIVSDLYKSKFIFENYVYNKMTCNSSTSSLGYSDGSKLNGDIRVTIVAANTCSGGCDSAPPKYGTGEEPLTLKRYIIGVTLGERGGGHLIDSEHSVKAHMIAAKSFVVARTTPHERDGMTIFNITNSAYDQVFCDAYEGCRPGSRFAENIYGSGHYPTITPQQLANLEKWYDETAAEFIFNENTGNYYGAYVEDYSDANQYCVVGSCLYDGPAYDDSMNGMDYLTILGKYFSDSNLVLKNVQTNTLSAISVSCTGNTTGGCNIPNDDFVYYSQRDYNNTFCGRTDGATIETSGCGVTSMAMVLSNLVDTTFTPPVVMEAAQAGRYCGYKANGEVIYGTRAEFFKPYAEQNGLTYDSVDGADTSEAANKKIKDTLMSGGLIIANVDPDWPGVNVGHFVVIKGITSDDRLVIADPMIYRSQSGGDPLGHPKKNYLTIDEMRTYMKGGSFWFYMFTGGKASEIKEKYCSALGAGYLGNPLNPSDTTTDFMDMNVSLNARCFPNYCGGGEHAGIDIPVPVGTPIYATDSGQIEFTDNVGAATTWGKYIIIDHQNGYKTLYAHLSSVNVQQGASVQKGQQIALSGATGNVDGPHLHLELHNVELLNRYGRSLARGSLGKGLMNAANYINKNVSYVGQTQ